MFLTVEPSVKILKRINDIKKRVNLIFAYSCQFLLVQTLSTREQGDVDVGTEEQPFYPLLAIYIL